MTEAASAPENTTRGPSDLTKAVMIAMAIAVILAPLVLMWSMSGRLTPDIAYKWASTRDGAGAMTMVSTLALIGYMGVGISYHPGEKNIFSWILAMLVGWYALVYVMGVCIETKDHDGASNPYVRVQQATPDQFKELALVRQYPTVAAEIRRAAADGRVTKGEAHDIIEGPVLVDARSEEAKMRAERDRALVLSN